ncbi:N-acetylmuramoyl-L-alanine amidase family protein [Winogradskyella jejuensis]|uniref:N-acetylmuramoyl-L-alanine amidase n=1 Tax=Winogradskyella jejuensis TaxID=1089305 RepID=A0A1M5KM54_9FLAO|nr:N-acetylmuramoyl-L-alanine amidase [Winogradskyella jejuensis]SHG53867.1 N-acetylmuramoyl-L-alanine amidase [Winogradskyella jejuensis]
MRVHLLAILSLITCLLVTPIHSQRLSRKPIVLIDPGHGGTDYGAVSGNGIKEKDIVLHIALKIQQFNTLFFENSFEIYLTRYRDTLIALGNRSKLAQVLKPDVFISLHCNQANNAFAKGMEVYVFEEESIYKRSSTFIAYQIQAEAKVKLGFKTRGIKQANFQVLRETHSVCPAVLVELGFLSAMDEANYLEQSDKQDTLALVVLESLIKCFEL